MGVSADYRMSGEVAGPVTFGWLRPVDHPPRIVRPTGGGDTEGRDLP